MSEPKDGWDKVDVVAKVLIPVVVVLVASMYTKQQKAMDDSQKTADRIVTLSKSLTSPNPQEQQFAIALLRDEKKKHPADVPDEVIAIAVPALVTLHATAPSDLASQAKQLAIDLSANSELANTVQKAVARIPARIYFHIRDESMRQEASEDAKRLQAKLGDDFIVPGIERVSNGPSKTELRYFRESDKDESGHIVAALKDSGVDGVTLHYVHGYESSTGIRPRHYELWYAPSK
jgi:hypothetical protein